MMTEITRRALLSGVTAAAATAAFGSIVAAPQLAFADSPDSQEVTFSRLSAVLTGMDQRILAPTVDPLGLNHDIFAKANEKNAVPLRAMLQRFAAADKHADKEQAAVAAIMKPASGDALGDDMRFLARSVVLAWYLGAWYAPEDLKKHFYDPALKNVSYYSYRRYSKNVLIPHSVLSPKAYTGSMVWRAMQAHPMGYSNLQFGYWAQDPPDLVAFITPGEIAK
jgi:D-sorbitol dehydrogenase-like protein